MSEERWRRIPASRRLGVPAGFEASSEGNVRSVPRTMRDGRRHGGQVLTPWLDDDGYQVVRLGRSNVRVNVAVQLAFAGPPEVRHLDGDRSNNKPGNLAYGSRVENEEDKKERGKEEGTEWNSYCPGRIGTTPVTAVTDAG